MKCPRRFCCQQASFSSRAERLLPSPLLTIVIRSAGDAQADQIVADRVGAALAERQVVFVGAARVGVPLDHHLGARPLLHPVDVLLDRPRAPLRELGRVEGEEHVAERLFAVQLIQRLALEDLLLASALAAGPALALVAVAAVAVSWLAAAAGGGGGRRRRLGFRIMVTGAFRSTRPSGPRSRRVRICESSIPSPRRLAVAAGADGSRRIECPELTGRSRCCQCSLSA